MNLDSIKRTAWKGIIQSIGSRFSLSLRDGMVAAGAIYFLIVFGIGAYEGPLQIGHFLAEDLQGSSDFQRMLLVGFVLSNSLWVAPITGVISFLARTVKAIVLASRTSLSGNPERQDEGERTNG